MKKRDFLFTMLSVCIITATAWAVVPLTGQVTTESGTPIPGATITITSEDGSSVTAKTDQSGTWRGIGVPPGKCTITVQAEGFQSATTSLTLTGETGIEATLSSTGSSGTSSVGLSNPFSGIPDFPGSGVGDDGADASVASDTGLGIVFCTHLYVLDDNGREHFIDYTLTALGLENEKWESRTIPIPVSGDITIRLVKEMPRETTFIDQIKLRVVEKNPSTGDSAEYDLKGIAAMKNRSKENLMTAFRNDGNHIPIHSSKEPDPGARWGVKRGDFLEITFRVPPRRSGYERKYYVLTFGYHVKKFVDLR